MRVGQSRWPTLRLGTTRQALLDEKDGSAQPLKSFGSARKKRRNENAQYLPETFGSLTPGA